VPVRRLVPYALLGLLTVGTAAGIALGVANQPGPTPAQWVAAALAATANAGTARFTIHMVASTPSKPGSADNLESSGAVITSGLLDFTRHAMKVTTVFPQAIDPTDPDLLLPSDERSEEIAIGRTYYLSFSSGTQQRWITETISPSTLAVLNTQGISSLAVFDSGVAAILPATAVQNLGAATIGNQATTKYAVSLGSPPACSGRDAAALRLFDEIPRTVWIDRFGRIVQERSVVREPVSQSSSDGRRSEEENTSVTTLRLSHFGAPVSITAPQVRVRHTGTVIGPTNSVRARSCLAAIGTAAAGATATPSF
jgi:hypothetical protein